jgi:hypothetical protein
MTKEEALKLLRNLADDFAMAASGEWVPDDDSCEASLDSIDKLIAYVEARS